MAEHSVASATHDGCASACRCYALFSWFKLDPLTREVGRQGLHYFSVESCDQTFRNSRVTFWSECHVTPLQASIFHFTVRTLGRMPQTCSERRMLSCDTFLSAGMFFTSGGIALLGHSPRSGICDVTCFSHRSAMTVFKPSFHFQ